MPPKVFSHATPPPARELAILAFWKERKIFEKSVELNKGGKPFVFFEGPPTANGKPGIHHVLSRVYKDIYIRFFSALGYYIPRRAGWDCHGLPVEREVEKEQGIRTKAEIEEKLGRKKFNELCRASVQRYINDWNVFSERMGFWIDLENPYYTMSNEYIESVWGLLKQIWDRGLMYRGYKVVPWDTVMGATMSDAEVSLGYKTVSDPSLTVRFRLSGDAFGPGAALLVWTTTPWTLPSNVALAVNPAAEYVVLDIEMEAGGAGEAGSERVICAAALQEAVIAPVAGERPRTLVRTVRGADLVGQRYEPLFALVDPTERERAYRVVDADFVTMDAGTGIVHLAPAYGADDLEAGLKHHLPIVHAAGLDGRFRADTPFAGKFFKDADPEVTANLKTRGLVWKSEKYKHEYPFGYRTGSPLMYYAKHEWYIRTTDVREELIKNNETIRWVPDNVKHGRFGRWLENNRDWALSRERFWGTPLPLWTDGEGEYRMIGSVKELEKLSGKKLGQMDLHLPEVDAVEWVDAKTKKTFRRVPEVIDCWFDSGAMPYAQWGGSPKGKKEFADAFPADFIVEAVDQTRGWFYTLLAISTMVSGKASYKNVICLGHVVDAQGEKMSKSKGNTVSPDAVFDAHGADAIRWYFLTGAPPGNSRRVGLPGSNADPVALVHGFFNMFMNAVEFFQMYAKVDGIVPRFDPTRPFAGNFVAGAPPFAKRPEIDRWILSSLQNLVTEVTEALRDFNSLKAGRAMEEFTESLSNWYIRRNRRRFWKGALDADKLAAYDTLYRCLFTLNRMLAPFVPFLAEDVYLAIQPEVAAGAAPDSASAKTGAKKIEAKKAKAKAKSKKKAPAAPKRLSATATSLRAGLAAPLSVHLLPWPAASLKLFDEAMLAEGDIVLRAANLGRAARKASGVRVRQPLGVMMVHALDPAVVQAVRGSEDVLKEELNVKKIEYLKDSAGILEYRIKPNLPRLGPRFGPRMNEIRAFLEKSDPREVASAVAAGRGFSVPGAAGAIELESEDVLVESVSKEGTAGAEGGGLLVAFDTRLTPALLEEGQVRDLVRAVQELRKKTGLEVTDRIRLALHGADPELNAAVEKFRDFVEAETLASLVGGADLALSASGRAALGGGGEVLIEKAP